LDVKINLIKEKIFFNF